MNRTQTGARLGRAAVLSALVAMAGAGMSLGVSATLDQREEVAAHAEMDRRTSAATEAVRSETGRYLAALRTTAAAVGAQQTLTAPEFAEITEPLRDMWMAGASSIALVVPATDDTVTRVQQTWRDRGATGLTLTPGDGNDEHAYAVVVTSLDGSPTSPGTDMIRIPASAAVLAESRRARAVTVSDACLLLGAPNLPVDQRQRSFVMAAPVFRSGGFLGWVQLTVHGQSFMAGTFAQAGQDLLDLELRAADPKGRQVPVAALSSTTEGGRDLSRTVSLEVANATWTLHMEAVGGLLPGARTGLPLLTAVGGLSATALLTALVWVLATSRERARAQVRVATDELHASETESRRQFGLLQAVLDGISDGVCVVGPDGTFLLHNPAAVRILGQYGSDAGAAYWQDHFGLFQLDGVPFPTEELPLYRALQGMSSDQVEMMVRNDVVRDSRVISVSARPIETASGERGAVAVFHDITARKHMETELRGFAGVVAHDLKSPLTAIRGYTELIAESLDALSPNACPKAVHQARRSADRVLSGALRMEQLITELLDFTAARDATLRLTEVSLRDIVDEVVTTRLDAPADIGGRPDVFVGDLPVVHADPVLLRQVIDNLVGNAIKYTPPGQAPRIDITACTEDVRTARVRISDRGIGIPDGEHAAVFDSFHRASNGAAHPGTGLGLAICRRIVERHGGGIEAAANPGGGTSFTFTLPLVPDDAPVVMLAS